MDPPGPLRPRPSACSWAVSRANGRSRCARDATAFAPFSPGLPSGARSTRCGMWAARLQEAGVEVAFLALHGRYGEDGTIQGLLEIMGIPYTGSGVLASALGMNKVAAKKVVSGSGLPTPDYCEVGADETRRGRRCADRGCTRPAGDAQAGTRRLQPGRIQVQDDRRARRAASRRASGRVREDVRRSLRPRHARSPWGCIERDGRPEALPDPRAGPQERVLRLRGQVHRGHDRVHPPGTPGPGSLRRSPAGGRGRLRRPSAAGDTPGWT